MRKVRNSRPGSVALRSIGRPALDVPKIDWPQALQACHNDTDITQRTEATMGNVYLEMGLQVIAIVGGVVALVLAGLQAAETWLDIGEKLKKRREKANVIDARVK